MQGGKCLISIQFHPASIGAKAGTLTINSNNVQGGAQSVVLTGNGTDFLIMLSRPTRPKRGAANTIIAGKSATFDFNISAANASGTTVTFSCSGAPANSTCSVEPDIIQLEDGTVMARVVLDTKSGDHRASRLQSRQHTAGTRPGNYLLQVTASTGALTRTISIPVAIQ